MTREEAIARIKEHKIVHKMNEPRAIYISEALDMAIKALEQTEEITKIVNELDFEDISSLDFSDMLYCMSGKEIKEMMWKMYCFGMDIQYTIKPSWKPRRKKHES